ncbi:His Kinase A (phospho-acceptor) domain-containing protein [Seinonella peptonophila]|uniref:histidine kinase n=1 Tax=Seinonella peptonophila TaxID=112248 RepID=A0A1M4U0Y5_9BACL|nr:sensor histidine kinase [Seinonella peptonophila]SHE50441.1 His Kinase A (phospho-acceptor) domain-containing protein [Seinonella peptonophila]
MVVFYISLIIILIISHFWWYHNRKKHHRDLQYIHDKLNQIIEQQTKESLLLFTEDQALQRLLIDLNRLLHHTNQTTSTYKKLEQSIHKLLTNMSHDLKTPLTVILGLSETLTHDLTITEQERQRLLKKIHEKAAAILELINQFFNLAKLESGDIEIVFKDVELNEICRSNLLFFYEHISSLGLEVSVEIPDNPIYAHIDPTALDRILKNLITNAIRYGNDGKIVGIRLHSDSQHAFIDIWDRGKGIPLKDQNLIFERLYTLENSISANYQGSGLGLAITKRLVEKLAGTLTLMSKPFEETVFTVQLTRISPKTHDDKGNLERFS